MNRAPLALVAGLLFLSIPASASTFRCCEGAGNEPIGLYGLDGPIYGFVVTDGLVEDVEVGIRLGASLGASFLAPGSDHETGFFGSVAAGHSSLPIHVHVLPKNFELLFPSPGCGPGPCLGTGLLPPTCTSDPISSYGCNVTYTPEPSTALLMAFGLIGLARRRELR